MGSSGADVIVGIVVALLVVLAVRSMLKAKKSGKNMCGGDCSNCAGCAMHDSKSCLYDASDRNSKRNDSL